MSFAGKASALLIGISFAIGAAGSAQATEVTAEARVNFAGAAPHKSDHRTNQALVVWLTPVDSDASRPSLAAKTHFQLAQKNKQFVPRMLVVPIGSVVDFPNMDPFFHNVFSLFNGKKFDLGLYESGSSRSVHFDRPGVSYIFCNIHPEMSAVVVTVPTTYYAASSPSGALVIHDVAPGTYEMHVWALGGPEKELASLSRRVSVSGHSVDLGAIAVEVNAPPSHKNKFGEDYDKSAPAYSSSAY